MSDQSVDLQNRAKKRWWLLIGILLLYLPLLVLVGSTMSFSDEDDARQFVERINQQAPAPPRPMPVLKTALWPEIEMRRDPFLSTTPETQPQPSAKSPSTPIKFVTSYRDLDRTYVLGLRDVHEVERFGTGDDVDGDRIESIDQNRVTLTSHGLKKILEISPDDLTPDGQN